MKKITVAWSIIILLLAMGMLSAQVNVTFRVNTSTVQGFTDSTDVLQVRGEPAPLAWSAAGPELINVGGDYWEVTVPFDNSLIGTTIQWKVGATRTSPEGFQTDFWEDGANRTFQLPGTDMTTGLAYVSHGFEPPYTPSDSVDFYFRVNMGANPGFNPATQTLSLVGHFPAPDGAANMWNPGAYPLTREGTSDYYFIHLKLAQGYIDTVENILFDAGWPEEAHGMHMYRFAIGNDWNNTENLYGAYWPSNENRVIYLKNTTSDTTVAWKWWNDDAPGLAGDDSLNVRFEADLSRAYSENGWAPGDTVIVRYGYNNTGIFGQDTLALDFVSGNYAIEVKIQGVGLGATVEYQYDLHKYGVDDREIFYDFDGGTGTTSDEKRKLDVPAEPTLMMQTVYDTILSDVALHRQPRFRNQEILPKDVTVYWEVDLRPPYYQVLLEGVTLDDIQGEINIGPDQLDDIMTWGVWMNGPAVGGWDNPLGDDWGADLRANELKQMWDDGTNGDILAGDSIFTRTTFYSGPDSSDIYGQVFKFGIYGGDNEAGSAGYGLNHLENIPLVDPDDPTEEFVTIHSQFGSINPPFYHRWDFDNHVVGIGNDDVTVVKTPMLDQNYPNPFNPVTKIRFVLPNAMDVKLVIYNALGQEVTRLLDGNQRAGSHIVNWNGIDSKGRMVSSGVYFYRLTAGDYDKSMKMVLMK